MLEFIVLLTTKFDCSPYHKVGGGESKVFFIILLVKESECPQHTGDEDLPRNGDAGSDYRSSLRRRRKE